MPAKDRRHYSGAYQRHSARVRAYAYASPSTRCWRCGRTLDEVRLTKPRAEWHAGHVRDGEVGGQLLPECSPCNTTQGAMHGIKKRTGYDW